MSALAAPVALVTARAARDLDEDMAPLMAALTRAGVRAQAVCWDDPDVQWSQYALALLRSTWDYSTRLPEFLQWLERAQLGTRVWNPLQLVRWNVDKHYLADLKGAGIPVVPARFFEPGFEATAGLQHVLSEAAATDADWRAAELVVKPAVGAGSRDAQRYGAWEVTAIEKHMARLLDAGRSTLLQPYLSSVDKLGETALIYFEGQFSHAIRKHALLRRGEAPTRALFAPERIEPREPAPDELAVGAAVLKALGATSPPYARVDLIRDERGAPRLLELELTEPSLFLNWAEGAADRAATMVKNLLDRRQLP